MAAAFRSLEKLDLEEGSSAWDEPVPLGPADLRHGTLGNGLKYYVRAIKRPRERAALSLAVKVGSVFEKDDERGVAHIVEHLAFNATQEYDSHAIVAFLESIGAQFGACQNASTSADETIYELLVPTDNPELLPQALKVLSEFATRIRCSQEDVDNERGAVMEEWRQTRDSAGRTMEAHFKFLMAGCKYADRLPIGLPDIIKNVSGSTVRAFYHRWYRPEHMAVFCIGDFEDPDAVVQQIEQALGGAAASTEQQAEPIPRHSLAPHTDIRYLTYVDQEAASPNITVSFKHPAPAMARPSDYLQHCRESVLHTALNNRFYKMSRRHQPPFFAAVAGTTPLCANIVARTLGASVGEGTDSILEGLEAILTEVARARLHGFSQHEIDAACRQLMADFETTYLERDQVYSTEWRQEYERHFLSNEFVAGREYEARLAKTMLPLIRPADVQELCKLYRTSCSCVVQVACFERSVSQEALQQVVDKVQQLEESGDLASLQDEDVVESVLPPGYSVPAGSITSRQHWPEMDATELALSNGMKVTYKRTRWLDDQVLLSGFAAGGLTEAPREAFHSCLLAITLALELGHLGLKPEVLMDVLMGKRVQLDVSESAYGRRLGGEQSPLDLELSLQMVHALFTHSVRPVPEELATCLKITRESIVAQLRNPAHAYAQKVRAINYGSCYYFEPMTVEDLDKVDPEVACAHFNQSFRNPAEFHLVLTGNMEEDELVSLIEKWLASIPGDGQPPKREAASLTELQFKFPEHVVTETVRARMVASRAQALVTLPMVIRRAALLQGLEEAVVATLACQLLETKLLQALRFKAGKVYNVSVAPNFGNEAPAMKSELRGDLSVSFSCDPEVVDRLVGLALQEILRLQEEGPTEEDVTTLLTLEQRGFEAGREENSFWHEMMVSSYQGRTFIELPDLDAVYKMRMDAREHVRAACTPAALRDALRRQLPYPCSKRYTAISLVPQPSLLQALLPSTPVKAGLWLAGGLVVGLGIFALLRGRTGQRA